MRVADMQYAFPFLVVGITVAGILGPGFTNLLVVVSLWGWIYYARVIRADVLRLKEAPLVEAARAIGCSDTRIFFTHLLSNLWSSVIVLWTFSLAQMIIVESSLSYLGLGVPPPYPSLGNMIAQGRLLLPDVWWVAIIPGIWICLIVLAINLTGDALRDALDPRITQEKAEV